MEQQGKRRHFFCKECSDQQGQQDQDLPVCRLMRLYVLVAVKEKQVAMRTPPTHVLVHAPNDDSKWGFGHNAPAESLNVAPARPSVLVIFKKYGFCYNDRDSQNMWLRVSHIQDIGCS